MASFNGARGGDCNATALAALPWTAPRAANGSSTSAPASRADPVPRMVCCAEAGSDDNPAPTDSSRTAGGMRPLRGFAAGRGAAAPAPAVVDAATASAAGRTNVSAVNGVRPLPLPDLLPAVDTGGGCSAGCGTAAVGLAAGARSELATPAAPLDAPVAAPAGCAVDHDSTGGPATATTADASLYVVPPRGLARLPSAPSSVCEPLALDVRDTPAAIGPPGRANDEAVEMCPP